MTGNLTSIARPYALAAFEYASAVNKLHEWDELLQTAAVVAEDPLIIQLLKRPGVDDKELASLFCDVLRSELDTPKKNFIRLLSEHKRFAALPEMAAQFKHFCDELEKKVTVQVTSAVPLTAEQQKELIAALTRRLKLQVTLETSIDPTLLAGAVIRIGDKVIDGSVRGKLNRLIEFI